jgi:DNA-binding NarL/FixJ family response regulator
MYVHHLLVAESPLYELGLECVIGRYVKDPVISICRDSQELYHKISYAKPDVIWWALPVSKNSSSLKSLLALATHTVQIPVIVLQHTFDADVVRALYDAGIAGFLSDLCSTEEISDALRALALGNRYLDHRVSTLLSAKYLGTKDSSHRRPEALTLREKEILSLIIDEYTTREIAEKLYISKCTVETHRLHMIRKLGVKNTAGLVREALSQSLCRIPMFSHP